MTDDYRKAFEEWYAKHGAQGRTEKALQGEAFQAAWHASRWIPVTERLPEEGEKVMIWDARFGRIIYEAYLDSGGFVSCFQQWSGNASHWQPLPEAPHE